MSDRISPRHSGESRRGGAMSPDSKLAQLHRDVAERDEEDLAPATSQQLSEFGRTGIGSRARGSGVFNPFIHALVTAKKIRSHRPQDDQPELVTELQAAVEMLDDSEKTKLVFKLVIPVLAEEVPVQALFALARATKHMPVAYATSAILNAKRRAGLKVPDLAAYGLVELVVPEDRTHRPFFKAFTGKERLEAAMAQFRTEGKHEAANALSAHLERAAIMAATNQARRTATEADASASEATTSDPEATPEVTTDQDPEA